MVAIRYRERDSVSRVLVRPQSLVVGVAGTRPLVRVVVVVAVAVVLAMVAPQTTDAASTTMLAKSTYVGSATMRFTGAVNPLGLLNDLTVSPSEVKVRAGGTVTFVNNSGASLTLAVAGASSTLPSGKAQRYDFPGGSRPQSFSASVTPSEVAVLGEALRSSGTVRVAAVSQGSAPAAPPPLPSPSVVPGNSAAELPDAVAKSAQASQGVPSRTPEVTGEPGTPGNPGKPGKPSPSEVWDFGAPGTNGSLEPDVPRRARSGADDAAAPKSTLSAFTEDGWAGLLIVVAAVLLIGVASAATRAVVARRRTVLRG